MTFDLDERCHNKDLLSGQTARKTYFQIKPFDCLVN